MVRLCVVLEGQKAGIDSNCQASLYHFVVGF